MKTFGILFGTFILAVLAATSAPVHAKIGCYVGNDARYPRASLLVENNTIVPVDVTASWVTPESSIFTLVGTTSVAPRSEQRFLYGIAIGRNLVRLKIIHDSNIFEVVQSVYVNNELDGTCQRTYKVIVTNRTFPSAILGTEPRPVRADPSPGRAHPGGALGAGAGGAPRGWPRLRQVPRPPNVPHL